MGRDVKTQKRRYDSPRRRAQAEATRRLILEAARELFVRDGYAGTTIDAIADGAGVAPETVYASFGNKRSLLWRLLEIAAAGDEEPIPVLERDWARAPLESEDPREQARMLARLAREVMERSAPILVVFRDAASTDPEIAEAWAEANRRMLLDHRAFVAALYRTGGLRRDLSVERAADLFWTLGSPEVYDRLVTQRGWTPAEYEAWFCDTLERTLLCK